MKNLALIFLSLLLTTCLYAQEGDSLLKQQPHIYKHASYSVDARVNDLLSRMTLSEKLAQLMCIWQNKQDLILDKEGNFDSYKMVTHLPDGIGFIARPSEGKDRLGVNKTAREMAEYTNKIQKHCIENTRLEIPVMFHEECLHGHAAKGSTSFPQPIALASTWDIDLVKRVYELTAAEARARGAHQALTPVVDVARDPRWGRFEETFGEDSYLVSRMGVAAVNGFQGNNNGNMIDSTHMIATLKHMTGHGQPESGNNIAPANISERVIREVFLPPFKAAVKEANAASVMASYNEIDGIPSHANGDMLNGLLRDQWGFEGFVVADYGGVTDLIGRHHIVDKEEEAAILALQSGVDVELPDMRAYTTLKTVFENEQLPLSILDTAVARVLRKKFEMGLFDSPFVSEDYAERFVGSEENAKLALEAAQKAIVLLKNENHILPLDSTTYKKIGVIGPNADKVLLGGYSDVPPYFVNALEGIKNKIGDNAEVLYAEGCRITEEGSWYLDPVVLPKPQEEEQRIAEAIEIAKKSDIIIMVMGGNELTSREAWAESHLGDRTDLQLVGNQERLLKEILALGKPVIVSLFNGRPLAINFIQNNVPAILECWYLGQESGTALADVLFGDVNPSGKLPATFPRSVGHLPAYYNYKPSARRGYLFGDTSPLYPFGHGLSYTNFKYGSPKLSASTIKKGENATVRIEISNTGQRKGEEIVQLYIRDKISSVTRPVMELKGFRKISLEPGESKNVILDITPEKLSFFNRNMEYVVETGEFDIMVGSSSAKTQVITLTVEE